MTQPNMNLKDAVLEVTKALPNGAAAVNSAGIDLGVAASDLLLAECELVIEAPALATADLPDAQTMTYKVQHDTDSAFGTAVDLFPSAIVQTGAGGAGAAAATKRLRLPSDVKRYIRVVATNSGAGDASDKSLTAGLRF